MSSGHASHKGVSVKPNTNASDRIDTASKLEENPQDILREGGEATRAGEEIVDNPAATERPGNKAESDKQVE